LIGHLFTDAHLRHITVMTAHLISSVVDYADRHDFADVPTPTPICGLSIVRARQPSQLAGTLYAPLLCLVLQGEKRTMFGSHAVHFSAGDTLIVSINMPTVSQIVAASPEQPYVSLAIDIDLGMIRSLQAELDINRSDERAQPLDSASIAAGACNQALAEAFLRLFNLHDRSSAEQAVMAPLLRREIHFRMLVEGHGGMLRRLAHSDSSESRINRAILKIQNDYASAIEVKELADLAGMSIASFHEHFKTVTATTPSRFLKHFRLLVAQQRLTSSVDAVSTIGFDVGYQSAAHFSRDYAREFGHPPSQARK
tara:strand:- start:181 stop:1113 length:933 start_codon:yes stop_codon:yes gene_type:complete